MFAVARFLVFALVFIGLNPITLAVYEAGVSLDNVAYVAAAHSVACFFAGSLLWRSPRGALWLARWMAVWLIVFAAVFLYADYMLGGFWFDDGSSYRTVLGLGTLLASSWWVGKAISLRFVSGRPDARRRQLRVALAATALLLIVAGALYWRGDTYHQALRAYEAGRYTEAIELLRGEVIDLTYVPMTPARRSASWRDAFVLLGHMHEAGQGVDPDPVYALRLYMGAAGDLTWRDVHDVDRDSGTWRYVGYGPGAKAAAEACRLATALREIALYCKGFEQDINGRMLGDTALAAAAAEKFRAALRNDDADAQLLRAATFGRIELMQDALQRGANPDAVLPDNDVKEIHEGVHDGDSWARDIDLTPLIAAAVRHHVAAVKLLLNYGADPNFVPADNAQTLLSRVVSNAHMTIWLQDYATDETIERVERILRTLLENGYEVTERDMQSLEFRHDDNGRDSDRSYNRRLQQLEDRCRAIIGA